MNDIQTQIGSFDPATKSVPVTFTSGDIVHQRHVNAVINSDGQYDEAETAARVADVASGVAHKIAVGAIGTAPEAGE